MIMQQLKVCDYTWAVTVLHVMIGSVNTDTTEEIMPDTTTPGDQLEAKPEVTAQSSGSEMDHSTTHSRNEGSL